MKSFTKWFSDKVVPGLNRFSQFRVVASIVTGFMKVMPFLITGALLQIVSNVASLIAPNSTIPWSVMTDLTFGLLSIVLAFAIGEAMAERLGVQTLPVGLFSISVFLILTHPDFSNSQFLVASFSRLGSSGLFVAIIAGIFVGEVMGQFIKRNWTISGKNMPEFVANWFSPIVPGLIVVIVAWLVAYIGNIDLHNIIAVIVAPILTVSDTYVGFLLMWILMAFLFTIGINPAVLFGVLFPLWFAAVGENAALVSQGLAPIHINTIQTGIGWVILGGTGATLTLNFLMFTAKSKTLKSLGRAAIVPSLMNINEPLVFGLPIVFNPILAIPFIINSGLLNPTIVWLAMHFDLVTKPFVGALIPWLPIGLTGFMFNQDWRGIVLVIVELVINIIIWYPFFKSYDKIMVGKEETVEA